MKIHGVCMRCTLLGLSSNPKMTNGEIEVDFVDNDFIVLQINDDNVYPFTCRMGHLNVIIQQDEKYEILFESASHAICDGYYKEGTSSIASSLERLYEYCIKIISLKHDIKLIDIDESWAIVNSQSERQFGAFIFLYLLEFGHLPSRLTNSQVKFRNDVIHKGYFPTLDEVLSFGEASLKIIFEILGTLRKECEANISEWQKNRIIEMAEKAKKITDTSITLSSPTIISIALSKNTITSGTVLKDYITELTGKQRK